MDLQDLLDCAVHVVLAWRLRVENLDRECTTGDSEARCVAVELGELINALSICVPVSRKPQNVFTFSAFIVAEVTINFKSLRRDKTA